MGPHPPGGTMVRTIMEMSRAELAETVLAVIDDPVMFDAEKLAQIRKILKMQGSERRRA